MKKYKKYFIALVLIIVFCISVCFIPINATRFIPVVEKQISDDLGINVHIDKLIFRFGPTLKIKAPIMDLMYVDGQHLGYINNLKFYVPWSTLINDDVNLNKMYADKLVINTSSNDIFLQDFLNKLNALDTDKQPNITFKNYELSYNDKDNNKTYKLSGKNFELLKYSMNNTHKLNTDGVFSIDNNTYISYNLAIEHNFDTKFNNEFKLQDFVNQIENLSFYSDIMADLKIKRCDNGKNEISGLVNIDNISVLDKSKKTPKSFIYLTFWGDKARIQSNIYAAADKKIYIDGIINNSKKPELDLKVKTDEINISDVFTKLKLLADCSRFNGISSLSGNLSADFSLKGNLDKIRSVGYLKISKGAIESKGLNINNISSNIDFSNNVIKITDTQGFVNNAPIKLSGKIDKNIDLDILMDKIELKHLFPVSCGIESGSINLLAKISGKLDSIVHNEKIKIENFKAVKHNSTISFDSMNIDTNKENIAYISNMLIKPAKTELIKLPLVRLNIEQDKIVIPDTNLFMPNTKIQINAEVKNYHTKNYTFVFNANGLVNSKDLSGYTSNSVVYPIRISVTGNKDLKNIESYIHLQKPIIFDEPSLLSIVSKLDHNSLKIEEISLNAYNENLLSTRKINPKSPKKMVITGDIENIENPVYKNIRIYIPQQLNIMTPNTVAQIKGDIFVNGKYDKPEIVGQLSIPNLVNQFIQLSIGNAAIDFNKDTAVLNAPVVKLADTSMGLNATISMDISNELVVKNVNVKSKYTNFDTLLQYKDNLLFTALPININDGKFYSERVSLSVYNSPLHMSALNTNFKLKDNLLMTKELTAELFNGKLSADLKYKLKDNDFDLNIMSRGVSAAPIFNIALAKKDSVSGVMDFDANLSGNLASRDNLNGDVRFEIKNGHIGTLGKLEHLLYAQNVVSDNMLRTSLSVITKAITLKDTGLFKYLRGDISLNNGIANIKMLQSQGPLMALFVKGQYSPSTDYAKLTVLGRLTDEVLNCLGAFGEFSVNKLMIMLTGEENKFNITAEDIDKLPQLPVKNTKEFRCLINGILEKPSSVIQFNWISYTQKTYKQKELPLTKEKIPEFVEKLPY